MWCHLTLCTLIILTHSECYHINKNLKLHGRYTRDIKEYEVVIPRKVNRDGSFNSYSIPHLYQRNYYNVRRKRDLRKNSLYYTLNFNGSDHDIELLPNHGFMSPELIIEKRKSPVNIGKAEFTKPRGQQCYYTGNVRNQNGSRVALSTCQGLVGYIKTPQGLFFIEPAKFAQPEEDGQHLHIVYQASDQDSDNIANPNAGENAGSCTVSDDWQKAWHDQLSYQFTSNKQRRSAEPNTTKPTHSYIESLIVADQKFISHHNNTDVEVYILTIMNMVSDYFHDESVGSLIDFVVVRIIYLEKKQEEMDLTISRNANKTLYNFCIWQETVNPADLKHPNHHDIAILLTRQDLCSDKDNSTASCSLKGLSNTAAACNPAKGCSINEDSGLELSVVVTHEVGHLLGCSHDGPPSKCTSRAEDGSNYIMAPDTRFQTNAWSNCSRKFITQFVTDEIGDCLIDEPVDQDLKYPDMLPGAMYDATFQCELIYGVGARACETESDSFCAAMTCLQRGTKICWSNGEPAADGTPCGTNKWCYDDNCVDVGERPRAIDGNWGAWSPWTDCSRTCGGGAASRERNCDSPAPKNKGRFCIGDKKQYQICNTTACNISSVPFREKQCKAYNTKTYQRVSHTWSVYTPHRAYDRCSLICKNERGKHKTMNPRVEDGTPCRLGVKDMCMGGICKEVGCDWTIGHGVVEDQCGICNGDGSKCTIVRGRTTGTQVNCTVGELRQIVLIPTCVRRVKIEMTSPSPNTTIALSGPRGKKFYLNGEALENMEGEFVMGSGVGVYTHRAPYQGEVLIAGPTTRQLQVYMWIRGSSECTPAIKYRYALPSECSRATHFHWEHLEWDDCSARCGGGSQMCRASCVENIAGIVSDSYCASLVRPEPNSRTCAMQPCVVHWRGGPWSLCINATQRRNVTCVKESAHVFEEDIQELDDACKLFQKPEVRRSCKLKRSLSGPLVEKLVSVVKKRDKWLPPTEGDDDDDFTLEVRPYIKRAGPDSNSPQDVPIMSQATPSATTESSTETAIQSNTAQDRESVTSSEVLTSCGPISLTTVTCRTPFTHKEVEDHIAPTEITLKEEPIVDMPKAKQACDPNHHIYISDETNAEIGDRIPEVRLDPKHKKVYHGQEALKRLKEIELANAGMAPCSPNTTTKCSQTTLKTCLKYG